MTADELDAAYAAVAGDERLRTEMFWNNGPRE